MFNRKVIRGPYHFKAPEPTAYRKKDNEENEYVPPAKHAKNAKKQKKEK